MFNFNNTNPIPGSTLRILRRYDPKYKLPDWWACVVDIFPVIRWIKQTPQEGEGYRWLLLGVRNIHAKPGTTDHIGIPFATVSISQENTVEMKLTENAVVTYA